MMTLNTRTNDTDDEEPHYRSVPVRGLIDDIELNSLINASSDTNVKDADTKGTGRDHLLLKCRDVIEELHHEIEQEKAQKRQLQQELSQT